MEQVLLSGRNLREMLFIIAVSLTFSVITTGHEIGLPSFSWTGSRRFRTIELPDTLNIQFSDGTSDSVVFTKKETIRNSCIWQGKFKEEEGVFVTVSGPCPLRDNFDITVVSSSRLPGNIFSVRNGIVMAFKASRNMKVAVRKADSRLIQRMRAAVAQRDFPPEGLKLDLGLYSDSSFRHLFGQESLVRMFMIIAHAQTWFFHPSLTVKIYLNVAKFGEFDGVVNASVPCLEDLEKLTKSGEPQLNLYFGDFGQPHDGDVGYANGMSYCGNRSVGIVMYAKSFAYSGETAAHEIAHTLGITHDFVGSNIKKPRKDQKGTSCYRVKGIMSYFPKVTQWSTCSVEDLQSAYNVMNCIKPNVCEDKPFCNPAFLTTVKDYCELPLTAVSCHKLCKTC